MSSAELERQQALLAALLGSSSPDGLTAGQAGVARGLKAYRLNAQATAERALAAVYQPLKDELGDEQFAAMAWALWRRHPPVQGDLARWGAELAAFMAEQAGMPERLPEQARLLWAFHEAERAADAELDLASLQRLDGGHDPAELMLKLMPGLSLLGGDVLVWRSGWRAVHEVLAADQAEFFRQLLSGRALGPALEATLAQHPVFDFAAWLQRALREPWLQAIESHK
ncbi:DNA-binding domain-containing protein [Pelomonas sp. SE-A7]|uniref:HvfC/BufC N-terminal domain-containing protein n=1 Tax=Pelomonas sp. SE-A7 TaxID=3054953 RepID=UPI00259C6B43|nr:DNA-binding domain-containing protein [Pelomonas sp. SE-A7]MDM4765094.1 DNA-binding domain-containing protein [Pelomonas sp. SE-A7]